jgi:hypothetical protein
MFDNHKSQFPESRIEEDFYEVSYYKHDENFIVIFMVLLSCLMG